MPFEGFEKHEAVLETSRWKGKRIPLLFLLCIYEVLRRTTQLTVGD
jgi:hypothetical protein